MSSRCRPSTHACKLPSASSTASPSLQSRSPLIALRAHDCIACPVAARVLACVCAVHNVSAVTVARLRLCSTPPPLHLRDLSDTSACPAEAA
eukprot:3387853-Alexandrium_andersonii.AAC.1